MLCLLQKKINLKKDEQIFGLKERKYEYHK